jgi:transcriptional regulator with PAS, ATPase and Fis domain
VDIVDNPLKNSRFILAFMQNLPVGLLIFDRTAKVLAANQAVENALGPLFRAKDKGIGKVLGCIQAIASYDACKKNKQCRQCKLRNLIIKVIRTKKTLSDNVSLELLIDGFFQNVTIRLHLATFSFEKKHYFIMVIPDTSPLNPEPNPSKGESFHGIIGRNFKMQELFKTIRKVATTDASVLIQGESGTGKELVAHAIHKESRRYGAPFVPLNCGGLPEGIVSSEFFGHEKGAFTGAVYGKKGRFELARGGTLFLDEVAELPQTVQVKLLRVLQEGTYERVGGEKLLTTDIRIISATNKNLALEEKSGRFRRDLYYRLCVMPISIPPLRKRKDDIPLLANYFLTYYLKKMNRSHISFSSKAIELMRSYAWPGNVRELQNTVQFALINCSEKSIYPSHLPISLQTPALSQNIVRKRRRLSRTEVTQALAQTMGNKQRAAELLGISRSSLYRFFQRQEHLDSTSQKQFV